MDQYKHPINPSKGQNSFIFSVIVPIYNTESWVQETIDCILEQSLDFHRNIQLILVNNGSTDGSGAICEKVAREYPENVVYIDLPQNIGPSGARNVGMDAVQGEYICFLDSDDYLSENALELGAKFFKTIPEEIDCVAIRTRCFEAIDDWEIYDYRFKETGIIDLLEYPTYFQFPATQTFLRASVAAKYRFDTRLQHSEDMLFINKVLLEAGKYGILKEAIYYYRKRKTADSLVSVSTKRKAWYCPPIEFNYLVLEEVSRSIYGRTIEYVQELIMFELQWRFTNRLLETLSKEELTRYCDLLHKVLQEVDDDIIWHQKSISVKQKAAALSLKYGYNVLEQAQLLGTDLCYKGEVLWNLQETPSIRVQAVEKTAHGLRVNCELIQPVPPNKLQLWAADESGVEYSVSCKRLEFADYLENFLLGQRELQFELPVRVGSYTVCGMVYGHTFEAKFENSPVCCLEEKNVYVRFSGNKFVIESGPRCSIASVEKEQMNIPKIKGVLKAILPPPVNTFNREITALKGVLAQQQAELCMCMQQNEGQLRDSFNQQAEELRRFAKEEFAQISSLLEEQNRQIQHNGAAYAAKLQDVHIFLQKVQKDLLAELEKINAVASQNRAQWSRQEKVLEELREKLGSVLAAQEKKIYYVCDYEAHFIAENGFYEIRECPDFLAKYQALVRGLDDESIATINRILSRHMKLKDHYVGECVDLFTPEEKEIIAVQRADFYANMPEIAPGVYACGKYLLASSGCGMGFMETTIFQDFAGFKKLRNPEKIRSKDILDIGAFIGDSTVVLAQFTEKNIYAFEPGYGNFVALEKTLKMNDCKNAIPIHAGIGAHSGVAKAASGLSMGVVLEAPAGDISPEEEIRVISVDEFVAQRSLKVGLIKVDVEGYEKEFLKGAEKTIREQKPALLLSMYHTAEDFFGLKPLLESWNVGYKFRVHKEINEHIHFDTMLIAEVLED